MSFIGSKPPFFCGVAERPFHDIYSCLLFTVFENCQKCLIGIFVTKKWSKLVFQLFFLSKLNFWTIIGVLFSTFYKDETYLVIFTHCDIAEIYMRLVYINLDFYRHKFVTVADYPIINFSDFR